MSKARDLEISTFISVYNGKWPAENDKDVHSGRQKSKELLVRWARWDSEERTLEIGAGKIFTPPSKCLLLYVFLPPHPDSPPFIFAGDNTTAVVGQALDQVAQRAAQRRTTLSVLVDQAVESIAQEVQAGSIGYAGLGLPDEDQQDFSDVIALASKHHRSMDAVICLATAACRSLRKVTVMDPFPYMFLDASGGQDFEAFRAALDAMPPVRNIASAPLTELQGKLLRWLTDLKGVRIKEDMGVQEMAGSDKPWAGKGIEPTFQLRLDHGCDPELEELEARYGSVEAFHGSALDNFHCILRCGLKSFSGDLRRMRTGDIYGEGVYLSSDLRLAHSFASRGMGWARSEFGTFLTCMAGCRVVLHPSVKHRKETARVEQRGRPMDEFPHTYYVVPDPRYIRVTSLIFVADRPVSATPSGQPTTAASNQGQRNLRGEGGAWMAGGSFWFRLAVVAVVFAVLMRWLR